MYIIVYYVLYTIAMEIIIENAKTGFKIYQKDLNK